MACRIATITSGKGGVGKTTTTGNLAVALANLDKRVVCLDLDIGLRNLDLILGLENRIVYDITDVIEGRVRWRQALVRDKHLENLSLLPAAQWRDKTAVTEQQVKMLCDELSAEFDFILIDSPAGIEDGFKQAVAPATEILLVATPDVSSMRDADRVAGIIEEARKPKPKLIVNRIRDSMVQNGNMLAVEDMLSLLHVELIGVVPEDPMVISETNKGKMVSLSRRSKSGNEFNRIARRLIGEPVPFAPSASISLFDRFITAIGWNNSSAM